MLDNDVPGPFISLPAHQEPAAEFADQLDFEVEVPTRQSSPDVDNRDWELSYAAEFEEMDIPTRQNSPDAGDLDQLSCLTIDSRWPSQARKDALKGLRIVLGDEEAEFKTKEQEDLVTAVLEGVHTVAILPTGGGKSMAFEIPPVLKGALTIVVLPFRAIITQVIRTAARRGLTIERWRLSTTRDISRTRLIMVAVETAVEPEFTS
jgi:superfamily II DNA helicase RecQ